MRKFKYDDGTDGVEYETLDELLLLPDIKIDEYEGYYYVTVYEDAPYYNIMYKVDINTRKATYYWDDIGYVLDIRDKAKPINPETLRRAS